MHQSEAPLENYWDFIDQTVCRPGKVQRQVSNGPKRVHVKKIQSIVCPTTMISFLYGPTERRYHESLMLSRSRVLYQLEQHSFGPHEDILCMYGNLAYPLRAHF